MSRKFGYERLRSLPSRALGASTSMRPGSATAGSGFSRTDLTHAKIVAFAPIPRASESTAAAVTPGFLSSIRTL